MKHLLSTSDMTVKEVADIFSFTPYYMSRFFRKHTGMTPTAFRAQ